VDLDEAHAALEGSNGAVIPAAKALGVPPHALKSAIDANAELQAITRNRQIEIVDTAEEVVLLHIRGDLTVSDSRVNSAWKALTNGKADDWSPKSKVDLNASKTFSEMSEKELVDFLQASPELAKLASALAKKED
jgi:hypothetical protein